VTTEHFTLQGARAATIAESTGRAAIFVGAVSAGLVALGLIATATRIGTTFYVFGLILLATLSFVGFVTFERVLQSGIEDFGYAERIARLRAYYFDWAPELIHYLASVPPSQRLALQGMPGGVLAALPDDRRTGRRGHSRPDRRRGRPARRRRRRPLGGRRVHNGRGGGRGQPGGAVAVPAFGLAAGLATRSGGR
jgi:hypothetical protein